jgi:hypothetical protein
MPSSDGGDDFVWIGGPGEGPGSVVSLGEEAVDGGLEVDDRSEDAAFEPALGEVGEEAFDGVEPAGRGGREVENEAAEPGANLGMFVDGLVVEDDVDGVAHRDLRLDGVEEADELLMAVALHAAADDLSLEDVQANSVVVTCRL